MVQKDNLKQSSSSDSGYFSNYYSFNNGYGLLVTPLKHSEKAQIIKALTLIAVDKYYDTEYIKDVFFYPDNSFGVMVKELECLLADCYCYGGLERNESFVKEKLYNSKHEVFADYGVQEFKNYLIDFLEYYNIVVEIWDDHIYNFGFIDDELLFFDPLCDQDCYLGFEWDNHMQFIMNCFKEHGYKYTNYAIRNHIKPFVPSWSKT